MRTQPKRLVVLSLILVGIALSFPFQVAWTYGHGLSEWPEILAKLPWLNWVVILAILADAALIFEASPCIFLSAPLTILLVNWNNFIVAKFETNYSQNQTLLASLLFFLLHVPLFMREVKSLLLHPELRWWRNPKRKAMQLSITVQRLNGEKFLALSYDLSSSGVFIPFFSTNTYSHHELSPPLMPNSDECVMLGFAIQEIPIHCQAQVVRKGGAAGTYPAGIGLKFMSLTKREEKLIQRFVKSAPENKRNAEITT